MTLFAAAGLFGGGPVQAQTPLWTFQTSYAIEASPTLSPNGSVYTASYDRHVYALNSLGSNYWSASNPPPEFIYWATYTAVYGTPAYGQDQTLFVPSENGTFLALSATNGAPKWDYETGVPREGLYSSPAIGPDGTVYFGSYNKSFYALRANGTKKWSTLLASNVFASPVVGPDGTVYCGCDDGKVYAFNPTNGAVKWAFDTGPYYISASPAVGPDGLLYVGVSHSNNPSFYSIRPDGTTNWVFTAGGAIRSSAALASDGTLYFGCDDGKLYALNNNGSLKWALPMGAQVRSSPALADDGTIYVGADDGKLHAVSAAGAMFWDFPTLGPVFASPAIGLDGTVYFASEDGTLYVVRGGRPPMRSAWPMFRQNAQRTGCASGVITNQPPVLAAIANQFAAPGSTVLLTNTAVDPDGHQVRYSLAVGAPTNAVINATNGVFSWTVPPEADGATKVIGIVATDNGWPALSDVKWFQVLPPSSELRIESAVVTGNELTLSWTSTTGTNYRVQWKTNLTDLNWTDLPGDVPGNGGTATKTDTVTPGQKFYRLMLVN